MKVDAPKLRVLFESLRAAGFEWQPQSPDRLLGLRKNPDPFRPLVRFFALGNPVTRDDLTSDGLPDAVFSLLEQNGLISRLSDDGIASASPLPLYKSLMAIGGANDVYVVHDHWPPDAARAGGYVHYAAESAWLARALNRDLEGFIDKRVLDLGCSSGALSFEVGAVAREVLGLDISTRAIEWARETARALGFRNMRFEAAGIGDRAADRAAEGELWDFAIMNPPMVVPARDAAYPHRDGGRLGIELPLLFLDFCQRHLKTGGEVQMLATNPIVRGRPEFFGRLNRARWEVVEKRLLHSHFNQEVARKQGYAEQGIERIELWFLHLKLQR